MIENLRTNFLEFYQNIYRLKVFPVMYAVNEFSTEKDDLESTTGTITSIYKIIE